MWQLREYPRWLRSVEWVCVWMVGIQVWVCDAVDGVGTAGDVGVVWAGEGEDFLVEGRAESYWGIGFVCCWREGVDCCWEVAEAVFDPAREHAWVPGFVEGASLEAF